MKKIKRIHLKELKEVLGEKEMKLVTGGSYGDYSNGFGEGVKPCQNNGCPGPHGSHVPGGLCCLLPCYSIWHDYGYGIVTGLSSCPW